MVLRDDSERKTIVFYHEPAITGQLEDNDNWRLT